MDIVTGILPKLHALKEVPLAGRNEIKTELVQMVKKDHVGQIQRPVDRSNCMATILKLYCLED